MSELDGNGWFITRHVLDPSLPDGFPLPDLRNRDRDAYMHVGAGGWTGYWPPEDSAVQPDLAWTEAHKTLVLAAYEKEWGRFLEDNQQFDIVWPPRAYLTTDGYVVPGPLQCTDHGDEDCDECEEFEESPGEIRPAEWSWTALIETYEWNGSSGSLGETEGFSFLTTLMDPRNVDFEG